MLGESLLTLAALSPDGGDAATSDRWSDAGTPGC
jgi:hypothetical protein